MSVRTHIIEKINAFRARHGIGRSAFGQMAVGDRKFLRDLEAGKPITLGRIEEAEAFMGQHDADAAGKPCMPDGGQEVGEVGGVPAAADGVDVDYAPHAEPSTAPRLCRLREGVSS